MTRVSICAVERRRVYVEKHTMTAVVWWYYEGGVQEGGRKRASLVEVGGVIWSRWGVVTGEEVESER